MSPTLHEKWDVLEAAVAAIEGCILATSPALGDKTFVIESKKMVLAEFQLPGLAGPDLAAAIRSDNPAQRIVMITNSVSVGRHVRRELGDIPVLNLRRPRTAAAVKEARSMRRYEDGEGKALLDWVEAGIALPNRRKKASRRTEA